jgi:hypothetical protein
MQSFFSILLSFFIQHASDIKSASKLEQLKAVLVISLAFSPVAYLLEQIAAWTIDNQTFITFVLAAIAIDHLLGSVVHYFYIKDFNWAKNASGLLIKMGLLVCGAIIFEGLNHIVNKDSGLKDYLFIVCRLSVFFYPAGSAFANMSIISGGKFPPTGWITWIKNFNENFKLPKPPKDENHQ